MISVTIDSSRAVAMLGHIIARGHNLPLRKMETIAYRSVLRNFNDQGRPQRWKELADSTKDSRDSKYRPKKSKGARRRKKWVGAGAVPGKVDQNTGAYMFRQYQALQDTGALKKSIHAVITARNAFVVRTNLKSPDGYYYPSVQQFGTKDGKVPARPFMVWQPEDLKDIRRILINHLINGAATS